MGRLPRFVPPECPLVEVTCRTIQGRMLLRPSERLNQIVLGLVARAARLYDMRVCAFVYLSNHCHLLLRPASAEQLGDFMGYLNGNLAREAGRIHGWKARFWGGRYRPMSISYEEGAQIARLEYVLSQGCKEGLVAKPQDWPGASSTTALMSGETIRGVWIDRTLQYRSRRRGERRPESDFALTETLDLSPLPCWDRLSASERRLRLAEILSRVEQAAASARVARRLPLMGRRKILSQDPHHRPKTLRTSSAPRFYTVSTEIRVMLEAMLRQYCDSYRDARETLMRTRVPVRFPRFGIPPPLGVFDL